MDDKKSKSDRKSFRCGDLNHLFGKCPKPPRNKEQKAFVGGSWSDSKNEAEDKTNEETCLMAQSSNEALRDESWVVAMQEELNQFVATGVWNLVPQPKNRSIIGTKWMFRNKLDENSIVSRKKARLVAQRYNQQEVKESLNVTFDESPPLTKLSPLVDDDIGGKEAIEIKEKVDNNSVENESIEVDEVVNIKESKNHPLEQVNGNLNQIKALRDESWVVAMQEELNQFVATGVWNLVPQPKNRSIIGTKWMFRNKLDENSIVSRKKARLVAQRYNQQEGTDYDETHALKFRLEVSKPANMPISMEIKLNKDDKADSMDITKYRGIPTASDELPLPDYFPTASDDRFPLLSETDAPDKEVFTANESNNNLDSQGSRSISREQQVVSKLVEKL
nr:copia protein [Tanacetum cinerariifolium]